MNPLSSVELSLSFSLSELAGCRRDHVRLLYCFLSDLNFAEFRCFLYQKLLSKRLPIARNAPHQTIASRCKEGAGDERPSFFSPPFPRGTSYHRKVNIFIQLPFSTLLFLRIKFSLSRYSTVEHKSTRLDYALTRDFSE